MDYVLTFTKHAMPSRGVQVLQRGYNCGEGYNVASYRRNKEVGSAYTHTNNTHTHESNGVFFLQEEWLLKLLSYGLHKLL